MKPLLARLLEAVWPGHPDTMRGVWARALPVLGNNLRMALVAVLAHLLARKLLPGTVDLTAALTSLLVMQASATTSLKTGLLRVVAVGTGVGMAIVVSQHFGMHWWSLGLVIFTALVVARLLRLGDNVLEVPISAMLILGAVGADVAAEKRLFATLIGTFVGIVFPLVVPPAIPYRSVAASVRQVADKQRELLYRAAHELNESTATRQMIEGWLAKSSEINKSVDLARQRISSLSEVRRFNTRATGTADVSPILSSGLDSLEHCLISLRGVLLTLLRQAPDEGNADGHDWFNSQVQHSLAQVMRDLGSCLASFGQMVEAEAIGNETDAQAVFSRNYRAVRDARADLRHLMESDDTFRDQWMIRGSLLAAVDQMLAQVDLDARQRVRHRWKVSQLGRSLPESHIGPRTTQLDRYRLRRMRRRQALRPQTAANLARTATTADFMHDTEITQPIPRISAPVVDPTGIARSYPTPTLPDDQ